jgi:hypothetical protein
MLHNQLDQYNNATQTIFLELNLTEGNDQLTQLAQEKEKIQTFNKSKINAKTKTHQNR